MANGMGGGGGGISMVADCQSTRTLDKNYPPQSYTQPTK